MPTETVYGLGADATNGEAVARIYSVKSRPQFNPLIVHVANLEIAKQYVLWNDVADALAAAFWPGPMTLILMRKPDCPVSALVSAGGDTLGIRIPSHPVAQQLLTAFGGGIAAPSANRSGKVSPTTAQHVKEELGAQIPFIVNGGACTVGLESTVIDVSSGKAMILRPGTITRDMIAALVPVYSTPAPSADALLSPGQLESHYAPAIPVRLNATELKAGEALLAFGHNVPVGAETTLNLSESGNLLEAAANLFGYLRALDNDYHTGIAVVTIPAEGVGEAINDRLRRAAHR